MTEPDTKREDPDRRAARRRSTDGDERYERLVELAPDGILIHDGEQIVVANAAAVRLAGAHHRDQLIGRPIDSFLNPPYLKAIEEQLIGSGDNAGPVSPVRDVLRRLDGSEVEVEVTAIPFVNRGRASAHLVIRDITERLAAQAAGHQAEEYLRHAQKMEAVGALAGGMAHEVNNRMSVALGFAEFLVQDPAIPADRLPDLRQIIKAVEGAATVTRELLTFSRRAFHHPQVVELNAVVRDIEAMIRRLVGEGHQLSVAFGSPCRVWADPAQIEEVVVNLALNARDAMPSGGTLTITTAEAALEGDVSGYGGVIPTGHYGLIVVRDTGIGMDSATQARIFEPFFTTKPVGEGTGLGLAAANGIMEQNKGYIAVASVPSEGTTFSLYLPLSPEDAVSETIEEQPLGLTAPEAGTTVLLVEDEPAVRAVVVRSLERGGFRVLQAPDAAVALQLADREARLDLVLTDLMMPGIGGVELARRLKERWPDLPVMFMSGYSAEELRLRGGAHDGVMIQKPFKPDTLLMSVNLALAARTSK